MAFRFPVRKENDEVYYSEESFVLIGPEDLNELKKLAASNPRQRARLCVHENPNALMHEMFIVHGRDAYVRPHRHLNRQEGLIVLEGDADLLTFSEFGELERVVKLNSKCFFKRLNNPVYHMLVIRSEFLVFYEATSGPFKNIDTQFAPWAPDGSNSKELANFQADLAEQISQWLK
jgi:cupin fold WbuC family metalloprotein